MPSRSQAQQRFFGAVLGGAVPKPKGMTIGQVKDFARTKRSGLPERAPHLGDGMTNTTFQQSEPVRSGKRPDWMERATKPASQASAAPKPPAPKGKRMYGVPHMADGKWAAEAFGSNKGGLHRALDVPLGKKIPAGKLNAATHSRSGHLRHMAQAAKNI